MEKLIMTVLLVVETLMVALLLYGANDLSDQLKEAQAKVENLEEKYERCVDKNERFQELYQIMVNENSHLLRVIRKYEPYYGMIPL